MKKYMSVFFAAIITSSAIFPQFTSEGFENWENGNPVNWFTSNLLNLYVPITQSNDAHSGSYAVSGVTILAQQNGYPPILSAGIDAKGFPINFRPMSINGWYKFHSDSGDAFTVSSVVVKNGQAIGSAGYYSVENTSAYKLFSVDYYYLNQEVPDTVQIVILISNISIKPGASFVLDDLALSGVTAVSENGDILRYTLEQNFPNPFNPVTTIYFRLPSEEFVSLKVFNTLGQEVKTLANEVMTRGEYKIDFSADNLPGGVYIYRLEAGHFIQSRKMLVLK